MDSQTLTHPMLAEFNEITDRALRCAQHQDLCGMSACLTERRKLLEQSRGFLMLLESEGAGAKGIIQHILLKDQKIAAFLKKYQLKIEKEVARFQYLQAQHIHYAGVQSESAHFIDRKI